MGHGRHEKGDEENPPSEDETAAERQRLNEKEGIELKRVPERPRDAEYRPPVVLGSLEPLLKTSYLKYALLTFNFLLALLGLVLIIFAIWVRVDPEFFQYDKSLNVRDFYKVCYMLIVVGVIILLVAFLGCFGVFVESQWMLMVYFVIYTIIFIIQLAAVILVFSAPYSTKMESLLADQIQKQVNNRETDPSAAVFMDFLQKNLHCCGARSQSDYLNSPTDKNDGEIPRSCLDSVSRYVHTEGCASSMLKYLKSKAALIGGISIPVLLLQLLALVVAYCLIYNIKKESRYTM